MKSIGPLLLAMSLALLASSSGGGFAESSALAVGQAGRAAATLSVGPDRLAAGMDVTVRDSVAGDLMVSGAVVSVTGSVAGDLLSAGGKVTASGPIAGSVRAAGGTITVAGAVGRNVTLAGGSVHVASTGTVEGNAYLAGGEVVIEGDVQGNVRASAETVRILGDVTGTVELRAERVVVGPHAHLAAGLIHSSQEPAEVAVGARIDGGITRRSVEGSSGSWIGRILKMAAFLFTGTVLVALFPGTFVRLRDTLRERPWPSMGLGLAALVVMPVALVLVAVTVLGLPLAFIGAALFAAALYVARAVVAVWLGDRFLGGGPGRRTRVVAFLLGGIILVLAGLLPWVGWAVTLLATSTGFGAVVVLVAREWRQGRVVRDSG